MALEINNINVGNQLTASTIMLGSQTLQQIFAPYSSSGYLPLSGGTVTGDTNFSAGLSANTLYSGSTNLYDIFSTSAGVSDITRVQPGVNISTGGTGNFPIINLVSSPSVNNINFSGTAIGGTVQAGVGTFTSFSAGTLSGGTILSAGTDLYNIFATSAGASDVTRVQPGSNISTGGTANFPIINLVASPFVDNITFSGTAIGGTVQAGVGTFTSLSGTNISATTYYGNGINLTGVVHGFTGTTSLDFGAPISGESSCAVTAITNSNINSFSNVIIRFIPSTDHESVAESMLEEITVNQSDIVDGVGFNINAYACEGTWGIYNIIYRIVN